MTERSDNVVRMGDFALRHKRRHGWNDAGECQHVNMTYNDHGEIITCDDCHAQLNAYWVLTMLVDHYDRAERSLHNGREALAAEKAKSLHFLAAKAVEKAWRSKTMLPACPHCHRGILSSDGLGSSKVNKRIELRRRAADKPGVE